MPAKKIDKSSSSSSYDSIDASNFTPEEMLMNAFNECNEEITKLKDTITELTNKITYLEQLNENLHEDNDKLDTDCMTALSDRDFAISENEELHAQINRLETENYDLQNELNRYQMHDYNLSN